jgi:hypothetical protein
MNNNLQSLIDIQFQEIGEWKLSNNTKNIEYNIKNKSVLNIPNVLYSFIVKDEHNDFVGYIGKTSKSIKIRFQGYSNPSSDQKTNIRIAEKILECLEKGQMVFIYALFDIEPLQWGNFSISLPAGLEDSIVHRLEPKWNIAGVRREKVITSTQELEELAESNTQLINELEPALTSFGIKLGDAYYNQGFMNPGIKASDYLGKQGESVSLILPDNRVLSSKIDRNANGNGSVRIYFGKDLSIWYQKKFKLGNQIIALIKAGNKIIIES